MRLQRLIDELRETAFSFQGCYQHSWASAVAGMGTEHRSSATRKCEFSPDIAFIFDRPPVGSPIKLGVTSWGPPGGRSLSKGDRDPHR